MFAATLYDLLKSAGALSPADVRVLRRRVRRLLRLGAGRGEGVSLLRVAPQLHGLRLVPHRVRRAPAVAGAGETRHRRYCGSPQWARPWTCSTSWRPRGRRRARSVVAGEQTSGGARAGGLAVTSGRTLAQRALPAPSPGRGRAAQPPGRTGGGGSDRGGRSGRSPVAHQVAKRSHARRPQARGDSVRGALAGRGARVDRRGHRPQRQPTRFRRSSPPAPPDWPIGCPGSPPRRSKPPVTAGSEHSTPPATGSTRPRWPALPRARLASRPTPAGSRRGPRGRHRARMARCSCEAPTAQRDGLRAGTVELAEPSFTP